MRRTGALVVLLWLAASAHAGGISRPNQISARGVGLGGAFSGIADDPTCWYFNPAGAAWADDAFAIGGELIYAPRSYTPVAADGTRGAPQKATALAPLPSLGIVLHPRSDGVPSRIAFGAGIFNTFGGQISYKDKLPEGMAAVNSSSDLVFELAAGVAYEVDDVFSIGGAVRMGLGYFAVDASSHPVNSNISAIGVGVGATLGAMLRPTPKLQIGLTWRSAMNVSTQGSGTAEFMTGVPSNVNVQQVQHWPQQASLGAAVWAAPKVRVAAQLDWTQWSSFSTLLIEFPDQPQNNQNLDLDWRNTWTARGGAELILPKGAIRAGAYFDTKAVPDRTIERQYLDNDKIGVSAGGTGIFGAWHLDGALDVTLPGTRVVPDNTATFTLPSGANYPFANIAPGDYYGYVVTVELALARRL